LILETARIRLRIEHGTHYGVIDALTGETPRVWRGNDLRVEMGLFYMNELVTPSNLATLKIEMFDASRTGLPFLEKEVLAEDIDDEMTMEQWNAGADQHAAVEFEAEDTNIVLNGRERAFWLVVSGVTDAGNKITFGGGPIIFVEDGNGNGLPGPIVVNPTGDTWRLRNGAWEAFFQEDQRWRPKLPVMVDGVPTDTWGDPV